MVAGAGTSRTDKALKGRWKVIGSFHNGHAFPKVLKRKRSMGGQTQGGTKRGQHWDSLVLLGPGRQLPRTALNGGRTQRKESDGNFPKCLAEK